MWKFGACLPVLVLIACGGSSAPAETPKPTASADAAEADAAAAGAGADSDKSDTTAKDTTTKDTTTKDTTAERSEPSSKAADDGPKTTRSAQDILTAPDVVFMFAFNESDVKRTADSKCTASAGNDPKKLSQCMAKARQGFDVDGYRFKEKDGKWWWLTLRMRGKVIHVLHKFQIEFAPEKQGSVTFKPKGKDLGSAPGRTPASVTFDVPNEYQIVMNDTKLGKLVYEAKIGTASD